MKIKFKKGQNFHIPYNKEVKLTRYKRFVKITDVKNKSNNLSKLRKRKNNKYEYIKTGLIKPYSQPSEFKNEKALKRTLNGRLKDLLLHHFCGGYTEKFITLTFDNFTPMFKDLTRFFNNFWDRLTRYCTKQGLSLICVYVKEVHRTGTWHIHALAKEINNKTLFIDINELKRIWGYGGVHINPVSSKIDNSGYEIDIEKEITDGFSGRTHSFNKLVDYMCKTKSKENVIPTRGRVYGTKGNLTLPENINGTYGKFCNNELKNHTIVAENTWILEDTETGKITNKIHTQYLVEDKPNGSKKPKK